MPDRASARTQPTKVAIVRHQRAARQPATYLDRTPTISGGNARECAETISSHKPGANEFCGEGTKGNCTCWLLLKQ